MRQHKKLSWTGFALAQALAVCAVAALIDAKSSGPHPGEIEAGTVKAIHDQSWTLTRQPSGSPFDDEFARQKDALRQRQQESVALNR
jgi:hypothetical protein